MRQTSHGYSILNVHLDKVRTGRWQQSLVAGRMSHLGVVWRCHLEAGQDII